MPKITNETSGQHQILLTRQGSYGQQMPKSTFTLTHRGRHQRAKRNRFAPKRNHFAPKRDFHGGTILQEQNARDPRNDAVQAFCAGPGRATRAGATTLCNFKKLRFSSY